MLLAGLAACSEGPASPGTGTLVVTTATQGDGLDPDGFTLLLDRDSLLALGANTSLSLDGLPAGRHTLSLSDLAANCTLDTPNPLTATVRPDETVRLTFEVACTAPGTVVVTTSTAGQDIDLNGYTVSVDGIARASVPAAGEVTITGVLAGTRSVALSGIEPNCAVAGTNPLGIALAAGESQAVHFEVTCAAHAFLRVTAVTGGTSQDPDGYEVELSGPLLRNVGDNESITVELAPGAHTVKLGGVASYCAVSGANPREVTATSGETAETTFEVTCGTPPPGEILVTTSSSGGFSDPNGYTVTLDEMRSQHIPTTGTVTFSQVAGGTHWVKLVGLTPGCGWFLVNPQRVTVIPGAIARVNFNVWCVP